ncbi:MULTISPECIES: hypothetical protein [unclassified Methanoregula]|uniref:hypothetical protein n=1 Tax=unclassified Methanoregula TaxID=2649730 RepID=UPI0025EA7597|nr:MULTISPECIES: hypothetical protein [unclassified Methanoregula]
MTEMTARPIVTERQRPVSAAAALVLLLAMVMAAGCTAPVQDTPATPAISPTPTAPLTDRELAEKAIADAKMQIEKTDAVIDWFRGNLSTRDDSQLPVIMTKREIAYSYVVAAEDELAQGNYQRAREKAQDAFTKANESYTEALQRQRFGVSEGCGKIKSLDIVIIFILVILCSFLPALLAAYTCSLFRMNLVPAAGQIRTYASRITDEHVFTGALVTFSAILFIGVVTKQIFHPRLPLSGTTITITAF